MLAPNLILLYVADPSQSADFYEKLFETAPEAKFPTYAAFSFPSGLQLGLWSTQAKNFVSGGSGHRSEIAFMLSDEQQVRQLHDAWQKQGVTIEQPPHHAVFGLTFVATDPDGHRIRVCLPDKT
jgi:predicted enzyme related to lactoylglutathione lyase